MLQVPGDFSRVPVCSDDFLPDLEFVLRIIGQYPTVAKVEREGLQPELESSFKEALSDQSAERDYC